MEIKEVRDDELKQVLEMYKGYEPYCDSLDFIVDYLERCECCAEIVFKEELEDREMWDGVHRMCCESCRKDIDADTSTRGVSEPDPYDIYMDRKMMEEMD